jgi:lipopolysaccharide transport system permease protein
VTRSRPSGQSVAPPVRAQYLRDLLLTLVGRDMKLRYKRSILGIGWSLLTPLAQLGVLYVTFDVLLPLNVPNYLTFLFTGLLVWNWFSGALFQATSAVVDNRELIKRPGFPIGVLPIVTVASHLIQFLLALPILFAFLLVSGIGVTPALLALPAVIALQFVLIVSLAYLTATLYVTFRDVQHLLGLLLNMLFYLTPVFYNAADVPTKFDILFRLNPMVHVLDAYRAILLRGELPRAGSISVVTVSTTALLAASYLFFRRSSYRFVDEL